MPQVKFYLPYGTFAGSGGGSSSAAAAGGGRRRAWHSAYAEVILHWFRVGREEPIAPYPSLVLGYAGLTPAARARAERTVDEFFSEEEFHLLRDYLRAQHGEDLRTAVLSAPVPSVRPDGATRAGALRPFYPFYPDAAIVAAGAAPEPGEDDDDAAAAASPAEDEAVVVAASAEPAAPAGGFCRLSEEEGYSLPFTVWGYYAAVAQPEPLPAGFRPARPFSPPPLRAYSRPSDRSPGR